MQSDYTGSKLDFAWLVQSRKLNQRCPPATYSSVLNVWSGSRRPPFPRLSLSLSMLLISAKCTDKSGNRWSHNKGPAFSAERFALLELKWSAVKGTKVMRHCTQLRQMGKLAIAIFFFLTQQFVHVSCLITETKQNAPLLLQQCRHLAVRFWTWTPRLNAIYTPGSLEHKPFSVSKGSTNTRSDSSEWNDLG